MNYVLELVFLPPTEKCMWGGAAKIYRIVAFYISQISKKPLKKSGFVEKDKKKLQSKVLYAVPRSYCFPKYDKKR
jgi:hypothetical protein